jgi:organic hydroperoxide reductase OsmC/OhrA
LKTQNHIEEQRRVEENRHMSNYPMTFSASASAHNGIDSVWSAMTADERELVCSIPKEFGGPNSGLSPEDLFVQALMNCYIATLKVIAQNSKMSFASIHSSAELTLDRDEAAPTPWMKSVKLKFSVSGVENVDRFRRLMERVSKQCMVLNSVKTEVHFEFEVTPS